MPGTGPELCTTPAGCSSSQLQDSLSHLRHKAENRPHPNRESEQAERMRALESCQDVSSYNYQTIIDIN